MQLLDGPVRNAIAAFAEDMEGFEKAVRRLVTVPLTAHQFDALVSFTYNCGEGNLAKSTLLKRSTPETTPEPPKNFTNGIKAEEKSSPD